MVTHHKEAIFRHLIREAEVTFSQSQLIDIRFLQHLAIHRHKAVAVNRNHIPGDTDDSLEQQLVLPVEAAQISLFQSICFQQYQNVLILRPVGDDWTLVQCDHPIDGWYFDKENERWNADEKDPDAPKFVTNFDTLLESGNLILNDDGTYTLTVTDEALALKAAHDVLPDPKPDPDGPDTPNPNPNPKPEPKPEPKPGPDTFITPEDPQLPPVQDARADTPDSPVLPASSTNPAVQDAHALPQTGTSLFAALAMALSGFALTIAGAWASLLGKNSRH